MAEKHKSYAYVYIRDAWMGFPVVGKRNNDKMRSLAEEIQ